MVLVFHRGGSAKALNVLQSDSFKGSIRNGKKGFCFTK